MSKKKLKLEAGKFYETRSGLKVEIFVKRGGFWVGCVYEVGTVTGDDWLDNGRYDDINGIDCELDIVDEWDEDNDWEDVDPTKIMLDMLPIECRFKDSERAIGYTDTWKLGRLRGCMQVDNFGERYKYLCNDLFWWSRCQTRKVEK